MVDERLTSWEAERLLEKSSARNTTTNQKKRRKRQTKSHRGFRRGSGHFAGVPRRASGRGACVGEDFFLVVFLILLLIAAGAGAYFGTEFRNRIRIWHRGRIRHDSHGSSSRAAARILEKNGVIRSALAFEFYARRHSRRSLQAGEYFFDHAASGKGIFGSWRKARCTCCVHCA